MTCSIFACLFALGLIALSRPLQVCLRFLCSAAVGSGLLFLGHSLGAEVGINGGTLLLSGLLGVPGAAGMLLLGFLL